jgi:group I intron endonuclease
MTLRTGIYEIRNTVNGKKYVGSAVDFGNRWRQHAQSLVRGDHHSIALQRAWVRYGPSAFQFNKLLACSKENLIMYEQICMDALKPEYSVAPRAGSQLGFKMSDEARAKMAEAARRTRNFTGRTHSAESRAKISAAKKGVPSVPCSDEKKAKLSAIHKGRVITEEQRAKISATLMGHKQSPEQIEKRAQKLRGRKMPAGFAEATSARMAGVSLSAEHATNIGRSKAKLTDEQVQEIRSRRAAGESRKSLSEEFRIDPASITNLVARVSYAWVP